MLSNDVAIAFQDCPHALLPDDLNESNPVGVVRMVDVKVDNKK